MGRGVSPCLPTSRDGRGPRKVLPHPDLPCSLLPGVYTAGWQPLAPQPPTLGGDNLPTHAESVVTEAQGPPVPARSVQASEGGGHPPPVAARRCPDWRARCPVCFAQPHGLFLAHASSNSDVAAPGLYSPWISLPLGAAGPHPVTQTPELIPTLPSTHLPSTRSPGTRTEEISSLPPAMQWRHPQKQGDTG